MSNIADLWVNGMALVDPTVNDITSAKALFFLTAFGDEEYPGPDDLISYYLAAGTVGENLLDLQVAFWSNFTGFGGDGIDTLQGDDLTTLTGTYIVPL